MVDESNHAHDVICTFTVQSICISIVSVTWVFEKKQINIKLLLDCVFSVLLKN